MCVYFFFFLHLGRFRTSSSHSLSSCVFHMDPSSTPHISYADGVNRFSRTLASIAWTIFTPLHSLVYSNGSCIGYATNNQVEYDVIIGLLVNALDHRILHLHVCLDSLLLVMQLNNVYHVHIPVLFKKYLRVKLLAREFESIIFNHVPRTQNHYVDTIANSILDWNLSHACTIRHP